MALVTTDSQHYASIAQAIREKTGGTEQYLPSEMAAAIGAISAGAAGSASLRYGVIDQEVTKSAPITIETGLTAVSFFAIIAENLATSSGIYGLGVVRWMPGVKARYLANTASTASQSYAYNLKTLSESQTSTVFAWNGGTLTYTPLSSSNRYTEIKDKAYWFALGE